jgi:predicted PurR-regulated permease PerM
MKKNETLTQASPPAAADTPRSGLIRTTARLSLAGLFLLALTYMLDWAGLVIMPFAAAVTIGMTAAPLAQRMERSLPPYLVSAILLFSLLSLVFALFTLLAIPAQKWLARMPEVGAEIEDLLTSVKPSFERLDEISETVESARETIEGKSDSPDKPLDVSVQRFSLVALVFTSVPVMISQLIMFVGGFYFFTANRRRLRNGLLSLFTKPAHRFKTARIVRDIEFFLSRYVASITVVNIGLGLTTAIVMYAVGMPSPELWGALAAILNFIPYLGPACVMVILAGVGLVTFDTVSASLIPVGAFLCLNIIESQFVTPAVVGNRLTLNPFLVFLSLGFWAWMWGPIGAFLAAPLLIMTVVAGTQLLADGSRLATS